MKKKTSFFLFIIILILPYTAYAEKFEFKHIPGSKYRILSVVDEAVDINGRLSHRAEILNRIAVEVVDVVDGKGEIKATFQTSERVLFDMQNTNMPVTLGYHWAREYYSEFQRNRLGELTIPAQYFMPVVRNVPVFPDKELEVTDEWRAEGHEVHDFRDAFGIQEPYKIPFIANYKYIGQREWKGKLYPAFSIEYRVASRPPAVYGFTYPVRISGDYNQLVYWDHSMGLYIASEEKFDITFELSNGSVFRFRGTARAEVIESEFMDKERLVEEITNEIERLSIPDVNVREVDEGVSISLEDIRFQPNSAEMLPGEHEKLDRIGQILMRYPDRDIIISGHTALAGLAGARMRLSEERAKAVADYLIKKGVRSANRVVTRGYGATRPVADNSTEEGMRRNRRVEITILEN